MPAQGVMTWSVPLDDESGMLVVRCSCDYRSEPLHYGHAAARVLLHHNSCPSRQPGIVATQLTLPMVASVTGK